VISDRRPALVRQDDLLSGNAPLPLPKIVMGCFATLAVSREGIAAVIYFAQAIDETMLVLDFDCGPMRGDLFTSVVTRLQQLAMATRSRLGEVAFFVQPDLVRQAEIANIHVTEIPEHLLDPDQLLLPAATHIAAGRVKMCAPAHEKSTDQPIRWRAGFSRWRR
jgi:hypothetical protein